MRNVATTLLNSCARSHWTQWPVRLNRYTSQLGMRPLQRERAARRIDPVLGAPQHERGVVQRRQPRIEEKVEALETLQILRRPQRRIGDHLGCDARLEALAQERLGDPAAVVDQVFADELAQLLQRRAFAGVVPEQPLQSVGRLALRDGDPAGTHQDQAADTLRPVQSHAQGAGAAEGIAHHVGAIDLQHVEQPKHRVGEVAERVFRVDALAGRAVAGHVRHDDPEALGQRDGVARVVRHPGSPRPAAVEHQQRWAMTGFGEVDPAPLNIQGHRTGQGLLRVRIHKSASPPIGLEQRQAAQGKRNDSIGVICTLLFNNDTTLSIVACGVWRSTLVRARIV